MEKYNNIFKELRALFPHAEDIRIEVDTSAYDIETFSDDIKEHSKSRPFIGTEPSRPVLFSALRTPFGMIKLNNV